MLATFGAGEFGLLGLLGLLLGYGGAAGAALGATVGDEEGFVGVGDGFVVV